MAESAEDAFFSIADSVPKGNKDNEEQGNSLGGHVDEHAPVSPGVFPVAAESDPQDLPKFMI